jgi:hypothetical protein
MKVSDLVNVLNHMPPGAEVDGDTVTDGTNVYSIKATLNSITSGKSANPAHLGAPQKADATASA